MNPGVGGATQKGKRGGRDYDLVKYLLQKERKVLSQDRPALEAGRCCSFLPAPLPMTHHTGFRGGGEGEGGCITSRRGRTSFLTFPAVSQDPEAPRTSHRDFVSRGQRVIRKPRWACVATRARHCVSWETLQLRSWRSLWTLVRSGEVPLCASPRPVSRRAGVGMAFRAQAQACTVSLPHPPLPFKATQTTGTQNQQAQGGPLSSVMQVRSALASPVSMPPSLLCPQLPG